MNPGAVGAGARTGPASDGGLEARRFERRRWWLTFVALAVVGGTWALATPLMSGPDESAHAVRAAAVAHGQIASEPGPPLLGSANVLGTVRVPEAYATAGSAAVCFLGTTRTGGIAPAGTDNPPCVPIEGGRRLVPADTVQHRGQPLYYAAVGWPSRIEPAATGMYLMRLTSAVIVAALLASAFASARLLPAPRTTALAVAATYTPVVAYLGGTVNSAGPEIAAAAALWVSAGALARSPAISARLVARASIALALLISARGLSPAFAVVVIAAVAPLAGRERIVELWRRRDVRVGAAVAAASMLASASWLAWIQSTAPLDDRAGTGIAHAIGLTGFYLEQTVTVFGTNDVSLPSWAGLLWAIPVTALIGAAWRGARRRRAFVVPLAIGVLALTVNVTAEGASLPPIGFFWQGRYVLPLLVGVPVLAAVLADRDLPTRRGLVVLLAAPGVVLHGWAFVAVGRHVAAQSSTALGIGAWLGDPIWTPPLLPAPAYGLVMVAAVAAIVASAVTETNGEGSPPRSAVRRAGNVAPPDQELTGPS